MLGGSECQCVGFPALYPVRRMTLLNVRLGSCGLFFAIIQPCNHTFNWIMTRGYTGLIWTHSYGNLILLGRMHTQYTVNSTTGNANFVHQVAYIYIYQSIKVMIIIDGPIHSGTSSPQSKHANHYTNENRQYIFITKCCRKLCVIITFIRHAKPTT